MEDKRDEAIRRYFEAAVVYRVSSLISALGAAEAALLEVSPSLSPKEMEAALNRLESLRRELEDVTPTARTK